MLTLRTAAVAAGTRVRVRKSGAVPVWSTWDDDHQRTSSSVKRRLQQLFFAGDKRIQASIVYIGNESLRDKLKSKGLLKVELRDAAGATVVILAEAANVVAA